VCPFPGAAVYSPAKAMSLLLTLALATALEDASPMGSPTERLLQPLWVSIVGWGSPYVANSLFAVTVATVTYVVVCLYFSWLDLNRSTRTKVQPDFWPSLSDMWAAAWPQLLAYSFGQLAVWGQWLAFPEHFTIDLPVAAPTCWALVRDLTLCVVVGDFLIYWEHRLMHAVPFLRNHIHSVHHRYTSVFSWAGGWVHPLEDLVVVGCQVLPVVALGPHPLTQWLFAAFWVVCLIDEHSGHDVWWSPYQLLPFTGCAQGGGAAPHDIHHYKPTKNFGFIFIVWDRLFGTFEEVGPACNPYVPPLNDQRRPREAANKIA